jgi:hypothetical protein
VAAEERRRIGAKLDVDGFPRLGTKLQADDPLYAYIDQATGECKVQPACASVSYGLETGRGAAGRAC